MRTTGFLPLMYLSSTNIGRTSSFPGSRTSSERKVVPEPPTSPQNSSNDAKDNVIFVKKALRNSNNKEDLIQLNLERPEDNMVAASQPQTSPNLVGNMALQQERQKTRHQTTFAVSLAFLSGILDVICFQRFGCFAHLTTGNTFKCLLAATDLQWKQASFLATVVACYTAGSSGFRFVDLWSTNRLQEQRHNRQRHSSVKRQSTCTISVLSFILLPLFGLSDIVSQLLQWPSSVLAFFWAFASGMVNASAMNSIGVVTNAVTGHWSKVGIGLADMLSIVHSQQHQRHRDDGGGTTPQPNYQALSMSRNVIAATAVSICATNVLLKGVARRGVLPTKILPPSGLVIGLLYFCLFQWYGRVSSSTSSKAD